MKKICKYFCLFLSFIFCSACISCTNVNSKITSSLDLFYFNTQIHFQTVGSVINKTTENKLRDLFSSLEENLSASEKDSVVYKFNEGKAGDAFTLTDDSLEVLLSAKRSYTLTDGKFNPTVLPSVKLWDFFPNYPVLNFAPPTEDKVLEEKQKIIDFSLIDINEQSKTKFLTNEVKAHPAVCQPDVLSFTQSHLNKFYSAEQSFSSHLSFDWSL